MKEKVVILGAGTAGLTAAYGLTNTKELRDRYDVSIYQVGWRAGGQCATGRSGVENRIEQNGTHYLFGCYDNTIEMTRRAYAELSTAGVKDFGHYKTSLLSRDLLALKHFFRGKWRLWPQPLPTNMAEPGVDMGFLKPPEYLSMFLQSLVYLILGTRIGYMLRPAAAFDTDRPLIIRAISLVMQPIILVVSWVLWAVGLALVRLTVDLLTLFGDPHFLSIASILSGLRMINRWLLGWLATQIFLIFRLYTMMDFGCTLGIGLLRDKVPSKGLRAIEGEEFRAWLGRHGASDATLEAPFVGTWYDAVAAYEDGDPNKPNLSAGVSLMAIGKALLTYKGHFAYQMRSEMGDTIIGPLYECLRRRGVKFHFFHRVRDVIPGEGDEIATIKIEQQVRLKSGDPLDYDPFKIVDDLKVWPNEPRWGQIEQERPDGHVNLESFYTTWKSNDEIQLHHGQDFDKVIMAMPVATFTTYCTKLLDRSEKWRKMAQEVVGVETQTMRLYFNKSLPQLGWTLPTPILSNYAKPFATWEDNGHLIEVETWPEGTDPKAIATIFGPLPAPKVAPPETDTDYPIRQQHKVNRNILDWLEVNTGGLWPKAGLPGDPKAIDWDKLVDLKDREGEDRLHAQYLRSNSGPLERYTMAKAGTAQYRLASDDSQFSNMVLAGDWTQNNFLIGSIEGAVISGLQASRAISGYPAKIPCEDTSL